MSFHTIADTVQQLYSSRKRVYVIFFLILLWIGIANFKWGYHVLGNDSFAPELNPGISLERLVENPAWRHYRALGVPSDSEQADLPRVIMFGLLRAFGLPAWFISQVYLWVVLGLGVISMAHVARLFLTFTGENNEVQLNRGMLMGGLLYMSSILTLWIFFFPVQLFVAAFGFLPLVVWRLFEYARQPSPARLLALALSGLLLGVAGLTATMFLLCMVTVGLTGFAGILTKKLPTQRVIAGLAVVVLVNAYWLAPFIFYVQSNTGALQESLINRKITTLQTVNEDVYTHIHQALTYRFSWMDDKLSSGVFAFPWRNWYAGVLAWIISLVPIVLAIAGAGMIVARKSKAGLVLVLQVLLGLWLIKGTNPPLGFVYGYLEQASSVFEQVFRWRSSKFWPLVAVSLPLLGVYGLVSGMRSARARAVDAGIILLLILNVFPLFIGGMMRESMYVKVPAEYEKLADYLRQHDPHARVYAAPEANTLYFRNYEWGFFGSVFLNYVLPNPIFEKALVIGSAESEAAFEVIKNAYYTGKPEYFTQALRQFNVEYVLEDRSVSKGESGYDYSFDTLDENVLRNNALSKVWSQGKLTLYQVQKHQQPLVSIQKGHDFTSRSKAQLLSGIETITSEQGTIFPLQLKNSELEADSKYMTLTSSLTMPGTYVMALEEDNLYKSNTHVKKRGSQLTLEPTFPEFILSDQPFPLQLPVKTLAVGQEARFVTVDGALIDMAQESQIVSETFESLTSASRVYEWQQSEEREFLKPDSSSALYCQDKLRATQFNLKDGNVRCGTGPMPLGTSSIVEGTLTVETTAPVTISICTNSSQLHRCVDLDRTLYAQGKRTLSLNAPHIFQTGESIEYFLEFTAADSALVPEVKINDFRMTIYEPSASQARVESDESFVFKPVQFTMTKPITMQTRFPIMRDEKNIFVQSFHAMPFTLESSDNGNSSYSVDGDDGSANLRSSGDSAALTANVPVAEDTMMFIVVKGSNSAGIPADVFVKAGKQENNLYENKLYQNAQSALFDYFLVPKGGPSLNMRIEQLALGGLESQNQISLVALQTIPDWWQSLAFVPVEAEPIDDQPVEAEYKDGLYVGNVKEGQTLLLNTAQSPYWSIRKVKNNKPSLINFLAGERANYTKTIVNGWNQGFTVDKQGTYAVYFWPNLLVFAGYFLMAGLIGGLGILSMARALKRVD